MDTTVVLGITANIVILTGVLIFAVAAIGLFKFRDTYARISAIGTAAGLGISLVIIGVFLLSPSWVNFVKLILILFLQLATSSIGTMAIARSAYLTGSQMRPGYFDHLADDQMDPTESVRVDRDVEVDAEDTTRGTP